MLNECLRLIDTEKKEVIYNLEKLEELTIKWSEDRGIIKNSNSLTQFAKLISETGELADNIAKGRNIEDICNEDIEYINWFKANMQLDEDMKYTLDKIVGNI